MLGRAASARGNLRPARDAGGHNVAAGICSAHRGEQGHLADLHRELVVFGFVTERTGHPAAARIQDLNSVTKGAQQRSAGLLPHRQPIVSGWLALLIAMAMQKYSVAMAIRGQRGAQAFYWRRAIVRF